MRLKADEPRDAIRAFEQALRLTPKRSQALLGLARARSAAGDEAGAAAAYPAVARELGKGGRGWASAARGECGTDANVPRTSIQEFTKAE